MQGLADHTDSRAEAAAAEAAGCLLDGDQNLAQEAAEGPEEESLHGMAGSQLAVDPIELQEDH